MPRQDREVSVRSGRFRLPVAETGEPIAPNEIRIAAEQSVNRTYRIVNSGDNPFDVVYVDPTDPNNTLTHSLTKNQALDLRTDKQIKVARAGKEVAIEGVVDALVDRLPIRPGRFKGTTRTKILRNISQSDYRFFNGSNKKIKLFVDGAEHVVEKDCSLDLRINAAETEVGTTGDKAYHGAYETLRLEGKPRTGRFKFRDIADSSLIINLTGNGDAKTVYRVINSGVNPFMVKTGGNVEVALVDPFCSVDFECASARKFKIEGVPARAIEGGTGAGGDPVYPVEGVYQMIKPL